MSYLKRLSHIIFKTNLPKTLWLNFKMLPFKQARKLPIYIYGRMQFRNLSGKIILDADKISSGMIKVGKHDFYIATAVQRTQWNIAGTMIFKGPIKFLQGSYILVAGNATLEIGGDEGVFGTNLRIFCFDHIVLGKNVRMAWDGQIMDSSFHYIELQQKDNLVKPLTKPIVIGNNVWIGNRTTISKGTVLPDYTIVASNSMVNKDFSALGPDCMLAGAPAIHKASGCHRIFDTQRERELDKQFNYTRTHL
ncbi:MAG: acyltransferase [Bacteroidales bacterium]|nr:acyltransferase [Bacteroidales bacterium]